MGVAGLQTFLEKSCYHEGGFKKVDVKKLADEYRQSKNKTPTLVFDMASCIRPIYMSCNENFLCGGQLRQFQEKLESFLKKLDQAGVEYVLITDGCPPDDRLPLWVKRRNGEFQKVDKVLQALGNGDFDKAEELSWEMRPILLNPVLIAYLKGHNIKMIQTVTEADDEIFAFAATNDCLGVVGQDSDFAMCQGINNYLAIHKFDFENLTTYAYSGTAIARKYNVPEQFLPVIATLCGNDIVKVATKALRFSNGPSDFLPRRFIIPEIAMWARRSLHQRMSVDEMAATAAKAAGLIEMLQDFVRSIDSYMMPQKKVNEEVVKAHEKSNWEKIIDEAHNLIRNDLWDTHSHCVVTRLKNFGSVSLQVYTDPQLPPSAVSLIPMRQKFYGILLKERPADSQPVRVEEYFFLGPDKEWPKFVDPIYPDRHPGLLNLWNGDVPRPEKWKLACWAISGRLKLEEVLRVPEAFQVPALAIFYMVHHPEVMMFDGKLFHHTYLNLRENPAKKAEEKLDAEARTVYDTIFKFIFTS